MDEVLHTRCVRVEEVVAPPRPASLLARVLNRLRLRYALVRGTPTWVQERAARGYAERLTALVGEWAPDVIQLEFHVMAQFLPALASSPAPRVLVQHEPGVAGAAEKGRQELGRLRRYLEVRAWRKFESKVMRQVDAVVVFTERDRGAVVPQVAGEQTRLVTIPLGIELPARAVDPRGTDPDNLLFFGSFRHEPNIDAATRLAREIFPRIVASRPGTTLHLVGADPKPEVMRLGGNGIVFLGEVSDLVPHLDRAAIVLVPLRLGGGMRVKVLEALAAGKAVVGSRLAFDGIELIDGEHVVFAQTDDEFVDAALALLANPARRESIGTSARAWAEANLSWDSRVAAYDQLYTALLEPVPPSAVAAAR
jgi:glycosyltransferase involved in cell wall biosynthesis